MNTEDFIPLPGRSVVFGFRNPRYWELSNLEGFKPREVIVPIESPPFIYRPAQIVRAFSGYGAKTCNLVVFVDGSNDAHLLPVWADLARNPAIWKTSVVIGDSLPPGSPVEHYLPRIPPGYRED